MDKINKDSPYTYIKKEELPFLIFDTDCVFTFEGVSVQLDEVKYSFKLKLDYSGATVMELLSTPSGKMGYASESVKTRTTQMRLRKQYADSKQLPKAVEVTEVHRLFTGITHTSKLQTEFGTTLKNLNDLVKLGAHTQAQCDKLVAALKTSEKFAQLFTDETTEVS